LESILKEVDADQAHNYVVEIDIPIDDVPSEIKGGLNTPGEDENENANFPPGNVYWYLSLLYLPKILLMVIVIEP